MTSAVVLLSIGRNPSSGRDRVAQADAMAIQLALTTFGKENVLGLHAAPEISAVLQQYLGLGLRSISCINIAGDCDPIAAIIERLNEMRPDVVLCGQFAETGRATGMTAYACARALQYPIVSGVRSVKRTNDGLIVVQDLGKGTYRELNGRTPAVLAVSGSEYVARIPAMANIRGGSLDFLERQAIAANASRSGLDIRPARNRPRRSNANSGSTTKGSAPEHLDPDRAANRILQYLRANNIIK